MNVLVLSPHTDDAELGAGGYIASLIEDGHKVSCLTFSCGEPRTGANPGEHIMAMGRLGIEDFDLLYYQAMHFPDVRQEVLQDIEEAANRVEPNMVLCPSLTDTHQDHRTVAEEAVRAFKKKATLMSWEFLPNEVGKPFVPNYYVELKQKHLDKKLDALSAYESQQWRPYMRPEYVTCLAHLRGVQVGMEYAEAFEIVRVIA